MSDTDIKYFSIVLEEIRDQNKVILEVVGSMQAQVAKLPAIEESIDELKQDVKVIKAAVTDLSGKVASHETRITQLETA